MDRTGVVFLSGLSGSGKSAALNCLEDLGYYCVDNLPPPLIDTFVDLCDRAGMVARLALVVDVRTHAFLDEFDRVYQALRERRPGVQLVFLDADDTVLQQRFSETRRPHPLATEGDVAEGIRRERERLEPIRRLADRVIDTSRFTPHDLREFITAQLGPAGDRQLNLSVMSFGFRNGLPENADLVVDVRFLSNPNYVPALKPLTGMDNAVREYVESQPETGEFLDLLRDLLDFLVPRYTSEGRAYLTIAFGCTGGQHRSVAVAWRIARHLEDRGHRVSLTHRDLPG